MEKESKKGRENGNENGTNDTKEGDNTRTADKEEAEKLGVERDTKNGVARNVVDEIKTDACQGPEAKPGRETTSEEPSEKVQSESDSAQPTAESQFQENARRVETKAGIKEPNDKTPDAPTAQNIIRDKMDGSTSNETPEALPGSGSGKTDMEESGEPPKADPPTTHNEGSGKTDTKESGEPKIADHSSTRHEGSGKTDKEESGEAEIADHLTAPPQGSGKTDEEESGEPIKTKQKTVVPEAGNDLYAEGAPENRANQQKFSKESAAATDGSTKQNGTTKQKANEEQVEARSTEHPTEETKEPSVHINKGQGHVSFRPSDTTANTSQLVTEEILTDKFLLSLSKRINLKNVPAESLSVYLGFRASDGAAAVIGANSTMNPQSAPNSLLSKFVMRNGRNSEIALNLRKRFLDNEMKDCADIIKAELDKFKIPVSSDEETLVGTPVIILSPPFDRPVLRDPTTSPSARDRNSGSKDPNDKKEARERKAKKMSEEKKRATENKANELKLSKEGAAAAGNGTKEDGTTNQKADNERVKEDDTNLPAEPIEHIKERPVSISVCTSAYDFNVQGLVSFLKDLMKDHPELIKEVKVHALPYNDLDHYKFPKENPVDVMLLCHSINNRRFAITDVMDALYDEYLPYCARVVGKNKMGVIVHDFEDMRETVQSSRMSSFKYKQPKAFETTSLQIICGNIEKEDKVLNQMLKADREKLPEFLKNASKFPEQMKEDVNANPSLLTLSREKYHEYKAQLSSFFSSSPESNTQRKGTQDESRVDPVRAEVKDDGNRAESREISGSQTKRRFGSGSGTQPSYLPKKGKSGGFHQTPQASMDEGNLNPPWDASPIGQRRSVTSNTAATAHNLGSPSQQPMVSGRTLTSASQRNLNPPREASTTGQQGPGTAIAAAAAHSRGSPSQQPMASRKTFTSAPQISTPSPRRISVSVCSSAYEQNVQGFMSQLTKLLAAQPHVIADVRFRGLPYNDIDSFKFPSNDPVDVMVLCHSTRNRGLSITNTLNALYDKYLQYCHDVIGKKKLAVIVHDFSDCKPKTLEVRMESFRRSQPLTFELADTVIVCGSLDKPGKVEMRDEDITRLTTFFEQARYEQRENYAVKQSFYKKSFLGIFG